MSPPALEVLEPGFLSTIQDLGRKGYFAAGIPPSGAFDRFALRAGNLLVGNPPAEAGIEMTLMGGRFRALRPVVIAITGADMGAALDGTPLHRWEAVPVRAGSELAFGVSQTGCRGYLCLAGGLDLPTVLGSKSTYLIGKIGGVRGRALRAGDRLGVPAEGRATAGRRLQPALIPSYDSEVELRVILGPQDDHVTQESVRTFLSAPYKVSSKADRVGYRFEGPAFQFRERAKAVEAGSDPSNIVDDGNAIGAIQIPGGREAICMGPDGVSMGGYVKIACLIAADLDRMGQAKPWDIAHFRAVTHAEAAAALRDSLARASEANLI
jgi:antagonist of KipI